MQRALRSVEAQTYRPIELVVVDDGSIDESRALIQAFRESWEGDLTFIRNETSRGAPAARNQAIEAAAGFFVAGLDDDDEWHPRRIQLLVEAYDPSYACITSDVEMQYSRRKVRWNKQEVIDMDTLLYSNQVGNQVLAERRRLLEVGGFDERLEAAQDYDLWIRLCERFGPVKNVTEPLQIIHAEHEKGRISNPASQLNGYLSFYGKHKSKMSHPQRKYQLFNIRRAQGKQQGLADIIGWVPPAWYVKEAKRWLLERYVQG